MHQSLSPRSVGELPSSPGQQEAMLDDAPGIKVLQALLEERLREPAAPDADRIDPSGEEAASASTKSSRSSLPARLLKVAAALIVAAFFGWMPLRTLLQPSSVEAIVNARVVTVRAPIEGEIEAAATDLSSPGIIAGHAPLLRVVNTRADRSRLDALSDQRDRLEIDRPRLEAEIASAQHLHDELASELAKFTSARIRQLEARAAALTSEIEVARAKRTVADAAAGRAVALAHSRTISQAELERATQEGTVAEQVEIAARRQLDAANVELEAARNGTFVGDSYNDRPSSAQRLDELQQRIDTLSAELAATKSGIAQLDRRIAEEARRYRAFSEVTLSVPVAGRIWELMTAPGEQVRVGQDLLKVLACSGAVVTANVTEAVYNSLSVGSPARFQPTDGGPAMQGVVASLVGFSDAPANFAIEPSALRQQDYRVTVRVPDLVTEENCAVGRTGRVVFGKDTAGGR